MEWLRNMIANRLAATALDWPGIYGRYNSGSYCNQNMILDYKQFTKGQPLPNGTFIISEQVGRRISITNKNQSAYGEISSKFIL